MLHDIRGQFEKHQKKDRPPVKMQNGAYCSTHQLISLHISNSTRWDIVRK